MKYKVLIVSLLLLLSGCSSKYKLFQEDQQNVTDSNSESKDSGFLDVIFPQEEIVVKKETDNKIIETKYPINFSYASKILPGDTIKIDIYNKSKRISLENIDSEIKMTQSSKQEYVVDMDGTLYLPMLNEVRFQGLTEKQASDFLTSRYKTYLTDPYIKVHIANKRVYVLGEVNGPGMLTISSNTVSIYEIIAKSGDLTDHAKRNAIQIISGALGAQKARVIDLTKLSSLNASDLMIPANSIIYVQPRYMKSIKITIGDFSPILGLISSMLGTYLSIDYVTNGRN